MMVIRDICIVQHSFIITPPEEGIGQSIFYKSLMVLSLVLSQKMLFICSVILKDRVHVHFGTAE